MIVPEFSEVLASSTRIGHVVAPAGFGKTHLIAQAVSHSTGRQLVLTHTYAGVNALRRKMRELSVRSSAYHVDTIASWALQLCLSYEGRCGWTTARPANDEEWSGMYEACARLLDQAFMRRIVLASYVGLYVDEYQDCAKTQHEIVLKLARDLPCRILGDPLQAIFDFDGQTSIDWDSDVAAISQPLGELNTPHRWNLVGAPQIGIWLRGVRQQLEAGQPIDLRELPAGVRVKLCSNDAALLQMQANTCRYFACQLQETAIAIHQGSQHYKSKCHVLAKSVSGKFCSIEEIEGKALFSFVSSLTGARTDKDRLQHLIEFACKCMTAVKENLSEGTKRGEAVDVRPTTKNPAAATHANAYLREEHSAHIIAFLNSLRGSSSVRVVRLDLFNRMIGVLRKHLLRPDMTLAEAAEQYHREFRHRGRPVGRRKLIGTTLLVKGLEFHHGIVLDATSLSRNELYVALTRGSKSLTIISRSQTLNPQNPRREARA